MPHKETTLNATLKALAQAGNMSLDKVQSLIDHCGGDEAWIEEIIRNASTSEKTAMMAGERYKATPDLAEVNKVLEATIEQLAALVAKLRSRQPAEAELKRAPTSYPPISENSLLGQSKKAAEWSFAAAFQGDLRSDMIPR